ncbi:acyltransferase [Actinoplanes sp. TBRC 11911]|uniref:acyltransferase family protein n=1 Tax=Actinoplanes sp. TBRC 11911 TaxID=2729386 RepID=UPI00145E25A0|nr:acyltransferase [Actinoplanes sp. TBRC 11911]NMO53856.1 acyltransferase [Actinoplanes sp. TBRC 11911]
MTETKSDIRPAAETHPAAGQTTRFRPDIEGLRAIAVLLIVLAHAGVPGIAGGALGVDVLFVLSGFLITASVLREVDRTGRLALPAFLGRRTRRILPAASLVVIVVVIAGYHWLGPQGGDEIAQALLGLHFSAPLQHFAALAVVVQFSLAGPVALLVLIWLGFRWALPYWVGAVVGGAFAYAVWQFSWSATCVWELGAGCLLALVAGRLERVPYRLGAVLSAVGLALIVIAALTFTILPPYATALPVVATMLVLAGRGDSLLGVRPLQWLSRLAYPFYLWHWPVLVIAAAAYGAPLPALVRALLVLGSLGLAAVTYVCVENPIRRMSGPLSLTVTVAFVLVAAPVAVSLVRLSTP